MAKPEEKPVTTEVTDEEAASLLAGQPAEGGDKETPTDETIEIKGRKIPVSEIEAWEFDSKNKAEWQKANTERAMEVADQRRQLDALYQQLQQSVPGQPREEDLGLDLEDPTAKAMAEMRKEFISFRKEYEQDRLLSERNQAHRQLKETYGDDYDAPSVEQAFIKGRNPFEDVYLSEKLKKLDLKAFEKQTREDERKKYIVELRERAKIKEKVSSIPAPGARTPEPPPEKPKTSHEAVEQGVADMEREGISFSE